jgi:serine/threonine protein kinase
LVTFLGSGSYGEVWKGKEKSRKREVAVKIETKIASYSELYFSIFI